MRGGWRGNIHRKKRDKVIKKGQAKEPGWVDVDVDVVARQVKHKALLLLLLVLCLISMASLSLSSPPSLSSAHHNAYTRLILRTPTSLKLRTRPHAVRAITLTQDDLKRLAADKAVESVKSGMVLGLGTGSTAAFVVAKLGALISSGQLTDIVGVPTSKRTEEQARSLGIPLSVLDDNPRLDLAIDGADEVDPDLNLVKGRGGALLREKMVEAASAKFVVVVDDTKLVDGLGGSGLAMPVEVVQFCWKYNLVRLQELFKEEGCDAKLRLDDSGKPYVTDNSNYIVDLYFKTPIKDALAAGAEISALEGVVEHGLFLNMATSVIIAAKSGVLVKNK
ncbi:putative ribose-5-phosphate isomerase 3, chloroplastic, partial [Mucuna pruriens]